jgi:hypothetical protein
LKSTPFTTGTICNFVRRLLFLLRFNNLLQLCSELPVPLQIFTCTEDNLPLELPPLLLKRNFGGVVPFAILILMGVPKASWDPKTVE